jgi:hypothetical protein
VEERWAWARANNVEPPAYAARPAGNGWQSVRLRDQAEGKKCCPNCEKKAHTIGEGQVACAKKPCCEKHESESQEKPQSSKGWVLATAALQCRGLSTLWLTSGAVAPPPAPTTLKLWVQPEDRIVLRNQFPTLLSASPPDPPPRMLGC